MAVLGNVSFFRDDNIIPLKRREFKPYRQASPSQRGFVICTRSTIYKGASLNNCLISGKYETNYMRWYILGGEIMSYEMQSMAILLMFSFVQPKTRETAGDARRMRAD